MVEGSILFDKEDPLFKEHFPGHPVVPGSLVIRELSQIILKEGLNVKNPFEVRQFKFRNFMIPGKYSFKLEETEKGVVSTVYRGSETYVTGLFV